jgi:DNA-binding transcriptional LysR family regulator
VDIRQLRYLIALAREKHFSRAAEACNVTQPTLSGRIRQLEEDLGVQIVRRGQRYHGLTEEGERVLRWARRIVEDFDRMRAELRLEGEALEGRLTIGAIPSALPAVPALCAALAARHPKLHYTVLSRSSADIERGLESFDLDAGITYTDNEPLARGVVQPLYVERYRLFVRENHPLAGHETVSWAEAAEHPLCALTTDMQNRRIVQAAFRRAGRSPAPQAESNSLVNLCAFVSSGSYASVLPEYLLSIVGGAARIRAVPLVDPVIEHGVGLVTLERSPPPRAVAALAEAARSFRPPEGIGGPAPRSGS